MVAGHAALAWIFVREPLILTRLPVIAPLTIISLSSSNNSSRISTAISAGTVSVPLIAVEPPALVWVETENQRATSERDSGRITPPTPVAPILDVAPFAQQAGLAEGAGATVVLRVEVSGSGAVGRVNVEVSGGNPRIDQAAIAYVRTLKWAGGRKSEEPETFWVRWGVHLER